MKVYLGGCMVLLAWAAMLEPVASQTLFKCKDADGRTLTSDRPIPECAERAVQVMGKDGVVRREIAAPLSPEEKRRLQQEADAKLSSEAQKKEQARADSAITTRYQKEADIELARQRAVEPVQDQLKRAGQAVQLAKAKLKQVEADVAGLPAERQTSAVIKRRLEDARLALAESEKSQAAREEELVSVNAKFAATLQRFREISGKK